MNDALAKGRRKTGRSKPLQEVLPVLDPPLSRTVIEGREEKPLSPSRERASGISRYRGHLDHLAGRDPDELMHEMRGQ